MRLIKFITIAIFLNIFSLNVFADEKADCSKIKNDTLMGNLKYMMCKKGSDKLDKDGNFKKGSWNIFKKKS